MKKILLSCMMLLTAVLSASAFTVYVNDSYTGKEGETFTITKFLTAGNTDQLQYTVTYEVNQEATGSTESTAAHITIKGIVFENVQIRNNNKDLVFPAFFAIQKRNGTSMGYGRVNMFGQDSFREDRVVESITLDFADGLIHYIGAGRDAFHSCDNLKHIYVKRDGSEPTLPTFDVMRYRAFCNTMSFTDPVNIHITSTDGDDFSHPFWDSGVTSATIYTARRPYQQVFEGCPNLTNVTLSGKYKVDPKNVNGGGAGYLAERCPKLTKIVWQGGDDDITTAEESPFYNIRDQITSLTIEGSVPAHMFEGFSKILMVSSPADLGTKSITIGERAFADCKSLVVAAVGGNMDQSAFEGCTNLKTIVWRGGFTWGTETPAANKSPLYSVGVQIKKVTFAGTNTSVPDYICAGMNQLETVYIQQIPNGEIGAHAFDGCPKLTTVDFSDEDGNPITWGNSYWIRESAFANCPVLHFIENFPVNTWRIEEKAFYNCEELEDCPITQKHTKLQYIGSEAFAKSALYDFVVPAGVTGTGSLLVNDCPYLEEIYFLPNTTSASNFGGSWAELFAKADSKTRKNIKNIYLNYNLTSIPEEMFMDYTELVNQYGVMPSETNPRYLASMDKVTTIQSSAFKNCVSLENCAALKSKALAQIYPSAFEDSNIKTSFAEMDNLTIIWNEAFKNCPNIERFGADKIDGADAVLPKLQTISADAFNGCYNLKSVHLPANLKTISTDAFADCPVETVLFGVTSYNYSDPLDNAGIDKTQIKVFEIGDNVTVIPAALAKGAPLKTVKIGYNIKSVGAEAFADCSQLKEVTINTNLENMPTNYNTLNPSIAPFARSAVEKASFGPAASVAGRCILAGTPNLKEVVLNKVVTFNEYSFANTGLTEFSFSSSEAIKSNAFANNSKLKTINISGSVPTVASSSFDGCSVTTINASCSCYGTVAASSTWKAVCSNIKNLDSFNYPEISELMYKGQGKVNITKAMDCDGKFTIEAVPAAGYSFVMWDDRNTENPRTIDMTTFKSWSIWPIFDNPALYTETIKLYITPENVGEVYVYDTRTDKEVTGGKYKMHGSYVFVPQLTDASNWYEFSYWDYESGKTATPYAADDETYPNGLGVTIEYEAGLDDEEEPDYPEELTAVFAPKDIPVEVRSCTDGHGTIKIEGDAKLGKELTLTALPNKGYKFSHWGSDVNATEIITKVTLSLENILKAGFLPTDEGTPVLSNGQLEPYEESALYYVEMCAFFTESESEVVEIEVEGNNCEIEGAGKYKIGDEVALNVIPDVGYKFQRWSDNNTDNPRLITVVKAATYTAICEATSPGGGSGTTYVCDFTKKADKHQQYTDAWTYDENWTVLGGANNNGDWDYVRMGGKSSNLANANPVYVVNNAAFDKEITQVKVYYPAGSLSKNGMAVKDWGVKVYSDIECTNLLYSVAGGTISGSEETLTVSAEEGKPWSAGYAVQVYWNLENTSSTNGIIYVSKIEYLTDGNGGGEETTYTITVVSADPAQGSVIGGGTFKAGQTIQIAATANEGYKFHRWDDGNTDNPRTIVVNGDETFTAEFTPTTGVDNLQAEGKEVRKVMIDGVIYVIKDEKMYNLLGVEVK